MIEFELVGQIDDGKTGWSDMEGVCKSIVRAI